MPTIFTKIIKGEIPCYKIAEDDAHFAFLDINPNAKGHTLCVPKKEIDHVLDLDEAAYLDLMIFSRKIARAINAAIPCERVGFSIVGLEVPHVHVHLIPLHGHHNATFQHKENCTAEEFEAIAQTIRKQL